MSGSIQYLSEAQRKRLEEIRNVLDIVVREIGATDEAAFNRSAGMINERAAAIRVWTPQGDYRRGDMAVDPEDGVPYWAIHDHGKSSGHVCQPGTSPTMWAHCHGTSSETARVFLAESYNPYNEGHFCMYSGKVWRCKRDSVVYSPDEWAAAWERVE